MIIYKTRGKMDITRMGGSVDLILWLTIWRDHIDSVIKNTYMRIPSYEKDKTFPNIYKHRDRHTKPSQKD